MPGGRSLSRAGLLLAPVAALVAVFALTGGHTPTPVAAADPAPLPPFKLEKGDHICIIGNTLADRMQHDGWVESFIYARHPDLDLTIRNLGFSGDEVNFRQRSLDFGTPDQWLSASAPIPKPQLIADKSVVNPNRFEKAGTKADVIFAFFGYNESFAGEEGLPKFKSDLEAFIKHTLEQKYNGKSAPKLVLFSPIAFEDHKSPNLPTGEAVVAINKNLALYTKAMGEVAKANGVYFADIFEPTKAAYAAAKAPLTINGVHLTEAGDRELAGIIEEKLFGGPARANREELVARLRLPVIDKAFHWYQRYRVTDGFSTFGGRAWLKFVDGQTNYEVVQKELEILDVKTANRDKVIWAAARGQAIKPDDSNIPKPVPVTTNKPGKGPNGTHLFLSGEDAIKAMTVRQGVEGNAVRRRKDVPRTGKPGADGVGRKGAAVGRGVAAVPTLEAGRAVQRQAPHPRRHRRRRQGRQVYDLRRQPPEPDRLRVRQRWRSRRASPGPDIPEGLRAAATRPTPSSASSAGWTPPTRITPRTASSSIRAARCTSRKAPSTTRRLKTHTAR